MRDRQQAVLSREVWVTQIPSGIRISLPAGIEVDVLQSLGGNLTVLTPRGQMVRIDAGDVDALGEAFQAQAEQARAQAAPAPGPYDEGKVWDALKTVYDPEIPVNIVDLGLIYTCDAEPLESGGNRVTIRMTMTAPGCGMGPVLQQDVQQKVSQLPGVAQTDVQVVWDPPWTQDRMSEAARLQLGWM